MLAATIRNSYRNHCYMVFDLGRDILGEAHGIPTIFTMCDSSRKVNSLLT